MRKVFIFLLVLKCFFIFSDPLSSLVYQNISDQFQFCFSPTLVTGSHVNGFGLHLFSEQEITYNNSIGVMLTPFAYENYYGIKGQSLQLNSSIIFSHSWGYRSNSLKTNYLYTNNFKYSLKYYLSYYYSTDKTSQTYGALEYKLTTKNNMFRLLIEEDDTLFLVFFIDALKVDKFRTFKCQLEYNFKVNENIHGVNLAAKIWTGDSSPLENNSTGYGSNYSHGIISLSYRLNYLKFSIGYDSEFIRDRLQNDFHKARGFGSVPLVDREDRIFFQLSIYPVHFNF